MSQRALSLDHVPDLPRLSITQRLVLSRLRRLARSCGGNYEKPATFIDLPATVGDSTLKILVERGLIEVKVTLTGHGRMVASFLAEDARRRP